MNIHKNARLTFARRLEMVKELLEQRHNLSEAACAYAVSTGTVRKWLGRYLAHAEALFDRSSRPKLSPRSIGEARALLIVDLRRRRLTQARIAASAGVSISTVSRVLSRAGLSKLRDLEPASPRCATSMPCPATWCISIPRSLVASSAWVSASLAPRATPLAGWEYLFVAIDVRASASICIPMRAKKAQCSFSRSLLRIPGRSSQGSAHRQRLCISLQSVR